MIEVTKQSQLTGKIHTRSIPVDKEALTRWLAGEDDRHVQDAFPYLTADDREFLLTGSTPEEWDAIFGGDDE